MPTELEGAVQLRVALRRFAPDLSKETQTQMAAALKTVTSVARGFVPNDGQVLSGWTKNLSGAENLAYRPFPKFNSMQAKAGITYSTSPSKPNKNGFVALARILNKSAAGAIYETAGRKNAQGQPNFKPASVVYRTGDGPGDFTIRYYQEKASGTHKGYNNSLNPNAGKQFIDNLNSTGQLVNARPKGLVGSPGRKLTGRLIFRAWAEDNGRANSAVIKALENASKMFYENTRKAA
tara:strand:- start:158 stop:865 length:708 start_codon:yes stop_codon:yes gene_type:complete